MQVECACGKVLKVADKLAGKKIRCPGCSAVLQVPAAEQGETEEAAEVPGEREAAAAPPPKVEKRKSPPAQEEEDNDEEERESPKKTRSRSGGTAALLDKNKFVVKSQSKRFSSKKSFEIVDGDSGETLGTAKETTGFLASLFGSATIEVRDSSNNELVFSVSRAGWLFKKDQVRDADGQVVGRYKSKLFSLSGGFHVYDRDGKHIAEIKGKMLKAEYKFLTPDRGTEMGSVSRTWGGLAKSLLSGDDSYGVQIAPKFADDAAAKMLILGAAIAVESIFKKKKGSKGWGGGGSSDEGDASSAEGGDE